ncbi:methyltransferase [Streptomonospora alba]|uniref:Methyltransferase n=2 Tax=Streptomonospora alba TaxID=183763 RepID=A0A0C2FI96_9ACTN|nr:methyltransferase [Streptomonospora alba]
MHGIANIEQEQAWNGYEGRHWADHHERYDAVNSGFNDHLLAVADIAPDDRVLDVGCGNGQVTRIAARAARRGGTLGIDLSSPMLARARELAAAEGIADIAFEQGDAQVHPLPDADFDVALSRFAVMFFADPVAAFANIARSLRPGGRLAFLSMRDMSGSHIGDVVSAMAEHLPPEAAGGFGETAVSFADPARIREVLGRAGFSRTEISPVDAEQVWGADPADAADFLCGWGPVRHIFSTVDPAAADRAREAAASAMYRHVRNGAVRLRGTAWLVTATRP